MTALFHLIVGFGLFTSFYYVINKMNSCVCKCLSASLTISLREIPSNGISRSTDLNSVKVLDVHCQIALRKGYKFTIPPMHEWAHLTVTWPALGITPLVSWPSPVFFSPCPSRWAIFLKQKKAYKISTWEDIFISTVLLLLETFLKVWFENCLQSIQPVLLHLNYNTILSLGNDVLFLAIVKSHLELMVNEMSCSWVWGKKWGVILQ